MMKVAPFIFLPFSVDDTSHPLAIGCGASLSSAVQTLLSAFVGEGSVMSLVRLLGFRTLGCGCVIGKYREQATSRELTYVEEKGQACSLHGHRRNHTVISESLTATMVQLAGRAS